MLEIIKEHADLKKITKKYLLHMPKGVRGRSSDNTLVKKVLKWQYEITLKKGLGLTYDWIYNQLKNKK